MLGIWLRRKVLLRSLGRGRLWVRETRGSQALETGRMTGPVRNSASTASSLRRTLNTYNSCSQSRRRLNISSKYIQHFAVMSTILFCSLAWKASSTWPWTPSTSPGLLLPSLLWMTGSSQSKSFPIEIALKHSGQTSGTLPRQQSAGRDYWSGGGPQL